MSDPEHPDPRADRPVLDDGTYDELYAKYFPKAG